jgi:hypothetical protein
MSQSADNRVKCRNCVLKAPLGFLSLRGLCADCEHRDYRKVLGESIDRTNALKRITDIARAFDSLA